MKYTRHTTSPWTFYTLEFQAYSHGNFYKYRKVIQEWTEALWREVNQVAWHMLTRQFAICHRAWMELKPKLWTRHCNEHCWDTAQEAFSDSCNTDYIVQRPIKGENDESSHSGHTMHKWQRSDSGGEGGAPRLYGHILGHRHMGNSLTLTTYITEHTQVRTTLNQIGPLGLLDSVMIAVALFALSFHQFHQNSIVFLRTRTLVKIFQQPLCWNHTIFRLFREAVLLCVPHMNGRRVLRLGTWTQEKSDRWIFCQPWASLSTKTVLKNLESSLWCCEICDPKLNKLPSF